MRTFDAPRPRSTPKSFEALTLDGNRVTHVFEGMTLLVAIKSNCDGCRDFVQAPLEEFAGLHVVIVSANATRHDEWSGASHPIVVAPEILELLDIRWPPFYVLIDAARERVVTEGVVFGPSQVYQEILPFL